MVIALNKRYLWKCTLYDENNKREWLLWIEINLNLYIAN